MEEQPKSTAGQGFGIASLILGILALLIAFIPCIGLFALIPGVVAIVLAIVGLSQANSANGQKGVIIAGLVISIVGTVLAATWLIFISTSDAILKELGDQPEFKQIIEEVVGDISDEIDEAIEESSESIDTEGMEDKLKELEKGEAVEEIEEIEPDTLDPGL